jgi:hypothetical protein
MKKIERWWVLTGLLFLLVGMGLGLKMAVARDYGMHGLHAHLHYWLHTITVAVALTLFYLVLSNFDLAPRLGPVMDLLLMGTYAGVFLFTYLFFTRAKD